MVSEGYAVLTSNATNDDESLTKTFRSSSSSGYYNVPQSSSNVEEIYNGHDDTAVEF